MVAPRITKINAGNYSGNALRDTIAVAAVDAGLMAYDEECTTESYNVRSNDIVTSNTPVITLYNALTPVADIYGFSAESAEIVTTLTLFQRPVSGWGKARKARKRAETLRFFSRTLVHLLNK